MLTPVDLETTVFRRGLRGYNTKDVQDFMNRIIQDYEYLYRENINAKEKLEELTAKLEQYQLIEATLRNAVLLGQQTAEEIKKTAENQAVLTIKHAEQMSEELRLKVKAEIQSEIHTLAVLKNQVEFFKRQFKIFLNSLMDLADKKMDLDIVWENLQQNLPELHEYQAPLTEAAATKEIITEVEATAGFKTEGEPGGR